MPELERIRPILTEKSEISEARLPVGELSGEIDAAGIDFRYKKKFAARAEKYFRQRAAG